jgi:Ran GTPase-activating protein 1
LISQVAEFADIFSTRLRTEIPKSLAYLLEALLNHPKLHTINLSDNAFGLTAQQPLINFLSAHLPLEHLILANNGLGAEAGDNIAEALTTLAQAKSSHSTGPSTNGATQNGVATSYPPLKTIICGRNRLGDSSMAPWAKCFKYNQSLTTIRMPQNGIRPDGIGIILREGIAHNGKLEVLDLQDNTFTLKGALALADILPALPELTDLGVGDCLLSARGGIVVAEALKKGANAKLESVRLQYNEIESKGAQQVLVAVKLGLPALKLIEFNGNKFADDDEVVEEFRSLFLKRGFGELDELDDMEEVSEDEDEEEEEEEEEESEAGVGRAAAARDILNKETKEEEDVATEEDRSTEELADILARAHIQ